MKSYDELKFAWLFQGGPGTFLDAIMQAVEGDRTALETYRATHANLTEDEQDVLFAFSLGELKRPRGQPPLCPVKRGPHFVMAEKIEMAAKLVTTLKRELKGLGHSVRGRHDQIVDAVAAKFDVSRTQLAQRLNEGSKPRRERNSRT